MYSITRMTSLVFLNWQILSGFGFMNNRNKCFIDKVPILIKLSTLVDDPNFSTVGYLAYVRKIFSFHHRNANYGRIFFRMTHFLKIDVEVFVVNCYFYQ